MRMVPADAGTQQPDLPKEMRNRLANLPSNVGNTCALHVPF